MQIRALVRGDLAALLALYRELNPSDAPLPDDSTVDAVWSETLSSPRMRHVGGFDGESLVTACTISVIPNLTHGCRPYGLVENVITTASHRRMGWGRAVLSEALNFAWSQNCYKVMLLTGRRDESVLRFYQSVGFSLDEKKGLIARSVV